MKFQVNCLLFAASILFLQPGCQDVTADNSYGTSTPSSEKTEDPETSSRQFEFRYAATIRDVPANSVVRVWFPVPETNQQQNVELKHSQIPTALKLHRDDVYGNQIGYFEVKNSSNPSSKTVTEFSLTYQVDREEARVDDAEKRLSDEQKSRFLKANSLVPVDGKPQSLLAGKKLPTESGAAGKAIYDLVEQHMTYDKSKPGYGNGDASWACDSKTGNCTDFHSLFISLARSQSIPARFEIGFPLPTDKTQGPISGYHCWAWFHTQDKGWSPVDISEADKHPEMKDYYFGKLTADRISFSTGRDIVLKPKAAGETLNFFVYPYVEVDGKIWPQEKIELDFSFKNIE